MGSAAESQPRKEDHAQGGASTELQKQGKDVPRLLQLLVDFGSGEKERDKESPEKYDFSNADLSHGDFQGKDLTGIRFSFVNLENAKLNEANLENANLEGAILKNADLRGAKLESADRKSVV